MQINKYFAYVFILALAFSCKKAPVETDNIFKYRNYISYTTQGRISVSESIRINLAEEVEGWEAEQTIEEKIVKTHPYIQGTLKALNKHSLLFTPDENLEPNTEYTVTVNLGEIYKNVPKEFEYYTFQFKTIKPSFNIATHDLQSYNKEWQYVLGGLHSADIITLEDAKQLISASQSKKNLNIVWLENDAPSKYFEFKIDSIKREIEDSKVNVKWNGKAIKADNKGDNDILIPGKNNFTIVETSVVQNPEQYLSINFSDPIKKQQNFEGLVTIQNVKDPKYVVNGNVLKVYPNTKLVGEIKVDVFTGIKNTDGFKLKNPLTRTIIFEELKPQVRLISNGSILPNSEDLTFNFEAVNLSKVDVRVIKIFEDNVLQFLQENNMNSNYTQKPFLVSY